MRSAARPVLRALACAAWVSLAACSPRPEQPKPPPAEPAPAAAPAAIEVPKPPPPLDRRDLLSAANSAAEAFATGQPSPPEAAALAGRALEVRLPFGCQGPGPETAPLRYAWDPASRRLQLTARPMIWTDEPWARALVGGESIEALEGFWLSRPWIGDARCPAARPASAPEGAPPAASPETVGLVQVFGTGSSRLSQRKGRAYAVTRKLGQDAPDPAGAFHLVLAGRVANPDDKAPIRCRSEGPDQRPTCLVMVEIDRVAFETAAGEQLAEWTN